jgi:hypothetical protein
MTAITKSKERGREKEKKKNKNTTKAITRRFFDSKEKSVDVYDQLFSNRFFVS